MTATARVRLPYLPDIHAEHLDEAEFLWSQWERAQMSLAVSALDVALGVEDRLRAHIDGLTVGGVDAARELLWPALDDGAAEPARVGSAALALMGDGARATVEQALRDGDDVLRHGHLLDEHRAEYGRINANIHETIHAAAGSRLLSDMVYLCQQVPVSSPRNVVAFEERDVRRRHDDHHRIFEAIMSRDPWRAEMLMRDHVGSVKSSLVRSLQSSQASSGATRRAEDANDVSGDATHRSRRT